MQRSHRPLRRRIASGDAPERHALCEIPAALIDELEYRTDFADRVQSRYRPIVPVEHAALRIGTQTALRVRAARIERNRVERRLRYRPHRSHFALEVGIVAGSAVAVPFFDCVS